MANGEPIPSFRTWEESQLYVFKQLEALRKQIEENNDNVLKQLGSFKEETRTGMRANSDAILVLETSLQTKARFSGALWGALVAILVSVITGVILNNVIAKHVQPTINMMIQLISFLKGA